MSSRSHPVSRRQLLQRGAGALALFAVSAATVWPALAHAGSYDDFFVAVRNDRVGAVRELLDRGFDPNTRDANGLPALMLAVREGAAQVTDLLLRQPKIQVEQRNAQDESALMYAAIKGDAALTKRLIAMNADVVKTGWTPLHYAASKGHNEVIRVLLEHHAYIDAESPNKTTPLMMAAMYGTEDAVNLLLEEGADPTLKNLLNMDAASFAAKAGRSSLSSKLRQAAEQTLARRAQPNAPTKRW